MSEAPHHHPQASALDRPIVRGALAAVLLAALGAGAFFLRSGGSSGGSAPPPGTAVADAPGPLDRNVPAVGQPAPDFALRDVNGNVVRLSDLRGKVVWVNFWATWCVPCKQELPDIQAVYDEKKAQGLEVLEVNTQESPDLALPYFEERSLTVPLLLDTRGGVYEQYKLTGLPDSFFIDRDGKVAALYFGQLSPQKMRERLATAGLP